MFKGDALQLRSVLLTALTDFGKAANFLLEHEQSNRDNEQVYCTLIVRCILFRQFLVEKSDSSSVRGLILDTLDRLESSVVHPAASCASQDDGRQPYPSPGLEKLHLLLATQFNDTQSKREALRDCVVFGHNEKQSALLEALAKGCRAARSETQTDILEFDLAPPKKRRQRPPNDIQPAALSLFEVLQAKRGCTCEPVHKYVVQLSLGTYRAQVTSRDFDLYFQLEQKWHEARVQTRAPAHSEASNVLIRLHTNVEGTNTSARDRDEQRGIVKELCKTIIKTTKKMTKLWSDPRLNLALEGDNLRKLGSAKSDFAIDKTKDPISLARLLADNLTNFSLRIKHILSVLLGYAVLHLHDTLWLSPTWGSDNVMFFRSFDGLPMRPYIRNTLDYDGTTYQSRPDDENEEEFDPDEILFHSYPCLTGLAVVLMEIHNAKPFGILSQTCGAELIDANDPDAPFVNAGSVFKQCSHKFSDKTKWAIEACLDPSIFDATDDMQSVIYERIVLLLEDELEAGFEEFPVDKLDSLVHELDLANEGQRILRTTNSNMKSTETLAKSAVKGDSSRRVRFQDSIKNDIVHGSQSTIIPGDTSNDQRQLPGKQIESTDKTMASSPAFTETNRNFVVPIVPKVLPDDRPNTLRVMNIPDDMSSSDLSLRLEQLLACQCKIHSLARASKDENWKKYATVTFPGLPNPILVEAIMKLQLQDLNDHLEFDKSFQGLTPLYDGGHSAIVDIVAIEGLGTNPFGTFRAPRSDRMWLRDFLPQSFPSCRVLLYGYDSKIPGSMSNQSVREIASTCKNIVMDFREQTKTDERPIIWLGQSMGGLIVQEVLVQAHQHRSQRSSGNLSDHSIGFLGYGVPMKGLQNESLLNAVKKQPNFELIRSICLEGDRPSHYLEDLANRFALCKERLSIYQFYETNPSQDVWDHKAVPQRRVDDQGVVGHSGSYWVSRNHSELVKIPDTTDFVYTTTVRNISLILDRHMQGAYS